MLACVLLAMPGQAAVNKAGELTLEKGPFTPFRNTALDDVVQFDNDIYSAKCHPLYSVSGWSETAAGKRTTGSLLLWLHRAHVAGGRVFVEPCETSVPLALSATRIEGYVSDAWFEATMIDRGTAPRVALRRLDVPGWGPFSVPVFCGRFAAFWSAETEERVHGNVVDLFDPRRRRMSAFGKVDLAESDMGWGLREASWDAACTAATFTVDDRPPQTLRVPR